MITEQSHTIDKVFLKLNTSSEKTAYLIKDNISSFLESELFPELEIILEKYDLNESVIRLDKLSVNVEFDKWENTALLKSEIADAFQKKLEKEIPSIRFDKHAAENHTKVSPEENREHIFLYFLENGRLPWYAKEEHIHEISRDNAWAKTLENKEFADKLKKVLATGNFAIQRFVLQLPNKMIFSFLKANHENFSMSDEQALVNFAKQLSAENQKLFLRILTGFSVNAVEFNKENYLQKLQQLFPEQKARSTKPDKKLKPELIQVLEKIHPALLGDKKRNNVSKAPNAEMKLTTDDENALLNEENGLLVKNAGLILLHPFLKSFFNEFEFLDETDQFLNHKKELAVQALHFLATGSEDFFEGNLLFEKFLCNVPQKWPIARDSLLNEQIKNEAESLLEAAIKNWPALKNTSPDGLRQNFLQRDGKLIKKEENYRLLVERKTQDILLDKLNWNISVVKLPWMKNLLHVEW